MPLFPEGLPWRGRATYVAHAGKALFRQHHRELEPVLRQLVPQDGVVLDVGAHAGQFAKLFARLAHAGHVFAFEPSGYARSILTLVVRARSLRNVTVVGAGLGDAPGALTLSTPLKSSGSVRFGLAHLQHGAASAGAARTEHVPVLTIDQFAAERGLPRLSFIKADIEGWEMRMLAGAAEALRRWRPPLLLELNDHHLQRAGDTLASAWRALGGWGYDAHVYEHGRLLPCTEPRDGDFFWLPR